MPEEPSINAEVVDFMTVLHQKMKDGERPDLTRRVELRMTLPVYDAIESRAQEVGALTITEYLRVLVAMDAAGLVPRALWDLPRSNERPSPPHA